MHQRQAVKHEQILYAERTVVSITGATGAAAGAYIVDIIDGGDRARHFGFMSACFGVGMVIGLVTGGLLGVISFYLARFGDDGESL